MSGRIEDVGFTGGARASLAGALHLPPETATRRGGVVMAHCFTCGKDVVTMTRLARGLAAAGLAVLRFDFTGLGASGGEFSETTLATSRRDLERAVALLVERDLGPIGLLGHSYGGAAALLAAWRLEEVRSVAVLGAPRTPEHLARFIDDGPSGPAVTVVDRTFALDPDFVADLRRHDLDRCLADLGRPLLVLHALDDEVVPVSEGEALFAAARQPKAFMPLQSGNHLLDPDSTAAAVEVLDFWFTRTL